MIFSSLIKKKDTLTTLPETATLAEALTVLENTGYRCVPVLDESGKIFRGNIYKMHLYRHKSRNGDMNLPVTALLKNATKFVSINSAFFSVFFAIRDLPYIAVLDENNQVLQTDTGQIAAVDAETAALYAQSVAASGQTSGFRDDYRYLMLAEGGNTRIIFLDCGRSLSAFRTTLLASVALSLLGLLAVLALLLILSHRIVRPMAESYEKQKQFITDAGHEL